MRKLPFAVLALDGIGVNAGVRHMRQRAGVAVVPEQIAPPPDRRCVDLLQMQAAVPVPPIQMRASGEILLFIFDERGTSDHVERAMLLTVLRKTIRVPLGVARIARE